MKNNNNMIFFLSIKIEKQKYFFSKAKPICFSYLHSSSSNDGSGGNSSDNGGGGSSSVRSNTYVLLTRQNTDRMVHFIQLVTERVKFLQINNQLFIVEIKKIGSELNRKLQLQRS